MDRKELAKYIDHTALKATTTLAEIDRLCQEAAGHSFAAVCVNPCYVELCARQLAGSGVEVATVVGFPLGATTWRDKAQETRQAVMNGATEIDMVINLGLMKSGAYDLVRDDIRAVVEAAAGQAKEALVKVIIECAYLTEEEKVKACQLSVEAGAHYVKTSTGFAPTGATLEDVALMRRTVGLRIGVKAAGGIRTTEQALAMIEAGASRLGASAGIAIIDGLK
ncbi:MAG: deoxyribose-phosphate aldolase [Bacillota bacterium]